MNRERGNRPDVFRNAKTINVIYEVMITDRITTYKAEGCDKKAILVKIPFKARADRPPAVTRNPEMEHIERQWRRGATVPILEWCRDHRTHHKFTDTDADPHNSTRGLFFSHVGNVVSKKHPDVIRKGRTISLDDLLADPVVRLQKRFFLPASVFMCIILPTWVPYYFWNEALRQSFCVAVLRYCVNLNVAFSVNSFAHWIGSKPYDSSISSADNEIVATFSLGEGFHNYHHIFPQDYATSEFGFKLNPTKAFIDFMAFLGLAYDRKMTPKSNIDARKKRSGDLHPIS